MIDSDTAHVIYSDTAPVPKI